MANVYLQICKHRNTGIQYKRKRSIDPSEIANEPSTKKYKRLAVVFVYDSFVYCFT